MKSLSSGRLSFHWEDLRPCKNLNMALVDQPIVVLIFSRLIVNIISIPAAADCERTISELRDLWSKIATPAARSYVRSMKS
jgi:hypothetical protein